MVIDPDKFAELTNQEELVLQFLHDIDETKSQREIRNAT
jgi:hypothetical protein